MAKMKFGIAVDEDIASEVDKLVEECDDFGGLGPKLSKQSLLHTSVQALITLNSCENSSFAGEREHYNDL
jgi:hypothetical protein